MGSRLVFDTELNLVYREQSHDCKDTGGKEAGMWL